jgi:hypothetical protein
MPTWTWADTNQVQATATVVYVILTFAYVIVTLVGFLLLRHQIKLVDLSTRGETHGYLYNHQHSITRFFIDNPNFRPFFYDNKEVSSTDSEFITLRAVTEMVADFSEHIYLQLPNLPSDIRDGWECYMRHLYKNSSALRLHFENEQTGAWYSLDFKTMLSQPYDTSMPDESQRISN